MTILQLWRCGGPHSHNSFRCCGTQGECLPPGTLEQPKPRTGAQGRRGHHSASKSMQKGTGRRSRRVRQAAFREAIGAGIAASKGDGPRVRDAATHVESGREVVDRRFPHPGVAPGSMAGARG